MKTTEGMILAIAGVAFIVVAVIAMAKYDFRYATVSDVKSITQERLERIEAKLDQLLKAAK